MGGVKSGGDQQGQKAKWWGDRSSDIYNPDDQEVNGPSGLAGPTVGGWVINSKMKRILLLEFKRTSDTSETYYSDMKTVAETQHAPILKGLDALAGQRRWEVEVLPLIAGQRSVRGKE